MRRRDDQHDQHATLAPQRRAGPVWVVPERGWTPVGCGNLRMAGELPVRRTHACYGASPPSPAENLHALEAGLPHTVPLHPAARAPDRRGTEIVLTPVQAPTAKAHAERWVGTIRVECLDWLLIVGRDHLKRTLRVYVGHYNRHRPHRALGLQPPSPSPSPALTGEALRARVRRRDLLGGALHEYQRAA